MDITLLLINVLTGVTKKPYCLSSASCDIYGNSYAYIHRFMFKELMLGFCQDEQSLMCGKLILWFGMFWIDLDPTFMRMYLTSSWLHSD